MSNNYEDYGYEDSNDNTNNNEKSPLAKKLLIIVLIIIAVLIILYLISGCSKGGGGSTPGGNQTKFNYEEALIKAGKLYYENNLDEMPSSAGECTKVTLESLNEKGLVDPKNFTTCNLQSTYVMVCILSNGEKHYTPWLACGDYNSDEKYAESKEGTLADVVADSSYIEFKFLPQVVKTGNVQLGSVEELWKEDIKYDSYKTLATTKYYRYRDKLYTWDVTTNYYYTKGGEKTNAKDVNEYYVKSPNSKYAMYDNKTTEAYKWYKNTSEKEYLMKNGSKDFSPVPVDDYIYNDGGITKYYERKVADTYAPYMYYVCAVDANSSTVVYQQGVKCGQGTNKDFTYQKKIVYSCTDAKDDAGASVIKDTVDKNTVCKKYTAAKEVEKCDEKNTELCIKVTMYNWYKYVDNGARIYYPSGATSASGESVYYTSAPASGYIKDETTKTTAYKWFRASTKTTSEYTALAPSGYAKAVKTSSYKFTDWTEWSKTNPKVTDGRDRSIETKSKIKLQQILGTSNDSWVNLADNQEYLTLDEMINLFKNNKYNVNSLEDINNNGETKYQVIMFIRNKKEDVK